MQTANGIIQGTHEADVYVKDLNDEKITCIIVKDCPALISLGLICTENGYDYIWKNALCPYLQKDGGKKIYCHPLQNVPTIAPATSAEGDFGKVAEESKDEAEKQGDGPSRDTSASPDKQEKIKGPLSDFSGKAGGDSSVKAEKSKPETCKPCHDLFTHTPKDPECEICNKSKIMRAPCRRKDKKAALAPDDTPKPQKIADSITADHTFLCDEEASRNLDTVALVIQDRFTNRLQAYASTSKSAFDTTIAFQQVSGRALNLGAA